MLVPFQKRFHVDVPCEKSKAKAWWRAWISSERKKTVAKIEKDRRSHLPQTHTWTTVAGFTCKVEQEESLHAPR